jgi:hypothetical protein
MEVEYAAEWYSESPAGKLLLPATIGHFHNKMAANKAEITSMHDSEFFDGR